MANSIPKSLPEIGARLDRMFQKMEEIASKNPTCPCGKMRLCFIAPSSGWEDSLRRFGQPPRAHLNGVNCDCRCAQAYQLLANQLNPLWEEQLELFRAKEALEKAAARSEQTRVKQVADEATIIWLQADKKEIELKTRKIQLPKRPQKSNKPDDNLVSAQEYIRQLEIVALQAEVKEQKAKK